MQIYIYIDYLQFIEYAKNAKFIKMIRIHKVKIAALQRRWGTWCQPGLIIVLTHRHSPNIGE